MIWFKEYSLKDITSRYTHSQHIGAYIGIEFTELGADFLKATMPVDGRTHQPFGILHGGSSVVLAETLGSVASGMCIDPEKYICVGLEVNANHLRPVKSGFVIGICTPIHIGGTIHVWDIKIYTEQQKLSCISRLTVSILSKGRI